MDLPPVTAPAPPASPRETALRRKAEELEAAFLAEMLAHAGLDATGDPLAGAGFAGGPGEAQFASFLRQEQARLMAARGGIGLAESIFAALARDDRNASA